MECVSQVLPNLISQTNTSKNFGKISSCPICDYIRLAHNEHHEVTMDSAFTMLWKAMAAMLNEDLDHY